MKPETISRQPPDRIQEREAWYQKSIEQSTIWNKVRPFFIRGAIAEEIAFITGLTRKQVNNAIDRRVKSTKKRRVDESFFAQEMTKERRSRVHKGRRKLLVDRPPMLQEERNQIKFAKALQEKGFFADDLTYWNKLNSLYANSGRELPSSFYDRLRLEAFVHAITQGLGGNNSLRDQFKEIGEKIDRKWFYDQANPIVKQQVFIREQLKSPKYQ